MKREDDFKQASQSLEIQVISNPWTLFEKGCEYGYQYAQTHPNWISVEDELPKENGKTQQSISVWATNGLMSCEMRYNFNTNEWTDMWGDPFDVTHWMLLPQPPTEKEE